MKGFEALCNVYVSQTMKQKNAVRLNPDDEAARRVNPRKNA